MFRLPDFIIIGAQRCGTSSLYATLALHPAILPVRIKELHFFDNADGYNNFRKGLAWYGMQFPPKVPGTITGEASPYYIHHPLVPQRMRAVVPDVKLIAILRNPVDRAYSHYWHEACQGLEYLPFHQAVAKEGARLDGEVERIQADNDYYSFSHHHHSYKSRGLYVYQLRYWHQFFPREQLLVLKAEEFFGNPQQVLGRVTEHLGIEPFDFPRIVKVNTGQSGRRPPLDEKLRSALSASLAPYNEELRAYLGWDSSWE